MCGGVYEEEFMDLDQFELLLKHHDWYYAYADDYRYYTKGRAESNAIEMAIANLTAQGLREQACQLYNELSPDDFFEKE
tara:strand:+ start:204 stop:440 length:237 start_codon:yes stop_codon:yes gene_type:complete